MGKAYERFRSLLAQARIDSTSDGIWLLALFARLCQPYTSPNCAGGHDMNTHVLFMLVMAFDMQKLLGKKLGCRIEHLLAAVLLHASVTFLAPDSRFFPENFLQNQNNLLR